MRAVGYVVHCTPTESILQTRIKLRMLEIRAAGLYWTTARSTGPLHAPRYGAHRRLLHARAASLIAWEAPIEYASAGGLYPPSHVHLGHQAGILDSSCRCLLEQRPLLLSSMPCQLCEETGMGKAS